MTARLEVSAIDFFELFESKSKTENCGICN